MLHNEKTGFSVLREARGARKAFSTRAVVLVGTLLCMGFGTPHAGASPLKVYILAGQSNMEGQAAVSTFRHIGMDPKTAPMLKDMLGPDGKPAVAKDVYIASIRDLDGTDQCGRLTVGYGGTKLGPKIGPEYTFGITLHKALHEPILLIKTAWGGKSLNFDFRPPSAGTWTPPPGHPDLIKEKPKALPIPKTLDLPKDYTPGREYLDPYGKYLGFFLFKGMRGCAIGEHNGVYPIYVAQDIKQTTRRAGEFPLRKGDVIVGLEDSGLRENPKDHWRAVVYGEVTQSDWMLTVARWRAGKIESVDIDLAEFAFPNGRADLPKEREAAKQGKLEREKNKGLYYRTMIHYVRKVLGDIPRVYPGYDPKQGYELAGFVWFQGWNDMVDSGTYPNREKPRGYEQYSWLLRHFIRDVRKDLDAPKLPFVIGVMGIGGPLEDSNSFQAHFREAMAAPAKDPAFKGRVAAVYTANYWDTQLATLANKAYEISKKKTEFQRKDGLEGKALDQAVADYAATVWTPEETKVYAAGRSNQSFHYLGSAKIMGQIGKGFAEALLKLPATEN